MKVDDHDINPRYISHISPIEHSPALLGYIFVVTMGNGDDIMCFEKIDNFFREDEAGVAGYKLREEAAFKKAKTKRQEIVVGMDKSLLDKPDPPVR